MRRCDVKTTDVARAIRDSYIGSATHTMSTDKICPVCGATYDETHVFCPRDSAALRLSSAGDELVGSVVGDRYLILELIGAGGMGEVYKAQDVRLQRPAAVKVLRAQLSLDLESLARFNREGANASRISNAHVAQIFDYGETEQGRPFLAMELVPGESLKSILVRDGALAPRRAVRLVGQIASALDAAHRLDVVHRDLKPENVLVCMDEGGQEHAKVVDFGISKCIRDDTQQVTSTGFVTGTREYMSPEQVIGASLDRRSDVYALGLVSYLMLTGSLPFAGASPEHSMLLRLEERPRRLCDVRPDVTWPREIQTVMDGGLAKEPSDRFSSAGEFARALTDAVERWLDEKPPTERGEGRRWWIAVAALLTFGAVGVLGYGLTREMDPMVTQERAEDAEAPDLQTETGAASQPAAGTDSAVVDSAVVEPPVVEPPVVEPPVVDSAVVKEPKPEKPRPSPAGELPKYGAILLAPDLSPDSARRLVVALEALLGRLTNRSDSVQADIYRAEAHALAGDEDRACAILDAARAHATPRQREKIHLWEARGLCDFSDWTPS
jgi:serine/threonine protein kinase